MSIHEAQDQFFGACHREWNHSTFPDKTLAVKNFPEPRNAKDVQSFLSLTGYFRKYVASYAAIAKPLSDLLNDSTPFKFGPEQKGAFQQSKLELHTDACKSGFGAIL